MEIALFLLIAAAVFVASAIKIAPQQNAWVVERLGRFHGALQPGLRESEGQKQAAINNAQGQAEAILLTATASAEAIRKVAAALSEPGGMEAVNLKVAEKYVEAFGNIAKQGNTLILPGDLSSMGALVATAMSLVQQQNLQKGHP